jgi:pyruvate dehydrogenase E2 component (dihydrolipoamide acetyltransferase)
MFFLVTVREPLLSVPDSYDRGSRYNVMDLKLPKLGEGADSGVVVSILVKPGERVEEGQPILEMENEKAVAPIPATASGTVSKIRVKEGDTVSVGQVLLTLSDKEPSAGKPSGKSSGKPDREPEESDEPKESEDPEEESKGTESETRTDQPRKASTHKPVARQDFTAGAPPWMEAPAAKVAASPTIRKLGRELGLDLARIRGSERGGRIGMGDLRTYIEALQQAVFQPRPAAGKAQGAAVESIDFGKWGEVTRKPLSQLRKTIASRMAQNWTAIPHVTQFDEADVTELMALRKKHAPKYEAQGARLTLTGFVFKAVAATLVEHPIFNSSLDEAAGELVLKQYRHIGLAVDTEAGLIVPVLRDVDQKNLFEVSREIEELAGKARDRKLTSQELQGGSFTISNQGGIGGAHFTPIVNKPEVAILGLGRGAMKPVVRGKTIEPRLMLPLALSYDHRVIDGGAAARFIVDLVKALEGFAENKVKLGNAE